MRIRPYKNISEAIKELTKQFINDCEWIDNAKDINSGQCGDFAEELEAMCYGDAYWGDETDKEMWSLKIQEIWYDWFTYITPYHAFVYYEGKYYDSESPDGVDFPDELHFFQREINNEPWVIECLKDNSKCIYIS